MCVIFTWQVPQVNKIKLAKYVLRSVSLSPVQILPIKCEFFPKLLKLHEQEDIPSYILYHRYYYCICTFFCCSLISFFYLQSFYTCVSNLSEDILFVGLALQKIILSNIFYKPSRCSGSLLLLLLVFSLLFYSNNVQYVIPFGEIFIFTSSQFVNCS